MNNTIFSLRIDEETYERLAKLAEYEERSINSQILYIIKKYLEQNSKEEQKEKVSC